MNQPTRSTTLPSRTLVMPTEHAETFDPLAVSKSIAVKFTGTLTSLHAPTTRPAPAAACRHPSPSVGRRRIAADELVAVVVARAIRHPSFRPMSGGGRIVSAPGHPAPSAPSARQWQAETGARSASQTMRDRLIETLFLDLDGTMLDWSRLREAIRSTCEGLSVAHPGLDALEIEKVNDAVWDTYWPEIELDWYRGDLDNDELGLEAWRRTFEQFGLHDADLLQATTDAYHRAERGGHTLFDDVIDTLAEARAAGIRLAVVTNGPSGAQRAKLEALGIDRSFDAVFVSAEVGAAKPDRAIFDFALAELDADPATAWHVGDLLDKDVAGAQAAGIRGIWLNRLGERSLRRRMQSPTSRSPRCASSFPRCRPLPAPERAGDGLQLDRQRSARLRRSGPRSTVGRGAHGGPNAAVRASVDAVDTVARDRPPQPVHVGDRYD